MIAEAIPPSSSVLDLGAGQCALKEALNNFIRYTPVDIQEWKKGTVVADFNDGQFPELGIYDVIVCQGIIEYIIKPDEFLKQIHKYGKRMIISYYYGPNNVPTRKNYMDSATFENALLEGKWFIEWHLDLKNEKIYSCVNWEKQ